MEVEGQVTEQVTEEQVTQSQEAAPQTEAKPADGQQAAPAQEGQEQAPPQPAYTPNYKYRAFGKEGEFDDFVRASIKDAETEKKIRDLYERAQGVELYKARHATLEQQVQEQFNPLVEAFTNIAGAYKAKDFDSIFSQLKIDEKDIYKWVAEKIRFSELPEEEKARYNEQRETKLRAASLERSNLDLMQRQAEYEAKAMSFELEQQLAKPEFRSAAEAFDAVYGQGAFKSEVVRTGQYAHTVLKKDLTVSEALAEAVKRAQPLVDKVGTAASAAPVQQARPAVIPNPQGRGVSAAKPTFKTLDEIRKHAETL